MTFTGELEPSGFKVGALGDITDVSLAIQQICGKQGLVVVANL